MILGERVTVMETQTQFCDGSLLLDMLRSKVGIDGAFLCRSCVLCFLMCLNIFKTSIDCFLSSAFLYQ